MLSHSPPTKARSPRARRTAPGTCVSRPGAAARPTPSASAPAIPATIANDGRIPTISATPPNIGPTTKPKTAIPNTSPSAWPRRSRGTLTATHASAPAHVVALDEALGEARDPERDRVAGEREADAGERERDEADEDAALGADAADEQPARDPADERPAAVRAEQRPRLELREVVVVGERGEEGDDRAEEHRVEKHDRARDRDDAAHAPRICGRLPATARNSLDRAVA